MAEVYGLFGHGCDIITPGAFEGKDDIPVPPGCIYVTLVLCGHLSFDLIKLIYAFRDPSIAYALKDPVRYLEVLTHYFKFTSGLNNEIHVHLPGQTYNDAKNTFICNLNNVLIKSGMYTLGNVPDVRNGTFWDKITCEDGGRYTKEMIQNAYSGSVIQPTNLLDVYPNLDSFIQRHEGQLMQKMSSLFYYRPGIYYNFACRPACDSRLQPYTLRRREISGEKAIKSSLFSRGVYTEGQTSISPRSWEGELKGWYNERERNGRPKAKKARRKTSSAYVSLKASKSGRNVSRRISGKRISGKSKRRQRSRSLPRIEEDVVMQE